MVLNEHARTEVFARVRELVRAEQVVEWLRLDFKGVFIEDKANAESLEEEECTKKQREATDNRWSKQR